MSLDFVELKRTLESLNAPLGAGEVFYVCPESDSWFSDFVGIQKVSGQVHGSIQKAVDACISGRGDTIVVLPGTYTYSTAALTVNKNGVTIMGLPGKLETTFVTTGVQSVGTGGWNTIDVTGTYVTISGLTVANGNHNAATPTKDVIYATGAGFTLKDSLIAYETNEGSALRGVVLRANHCKVLNTRFDNCIVGGSALFLDVAGGTLRNPLIEGCSFVGVNKNADSNFCIGAAATSANEIYGLLIKGCTFDPSGSGGGGGEDMLQLINGTGGKSYEGMIVDCIFGVDVSAAGEMGNIGTTLRLAGCFGTNDVSKGQPA
tara:strand:+ start:37 stop:990 length:954 start_codon:yes stop_codon:yes gene_type:complete